MHSSPSHTTTFPNHSVTLYSFSSYQTSSSTNYLLFLKSDLWLKALILSLNRYIIQPLSTMFTMSSSWIITATTLFRLIAVVAPIKARHLITKKLAYSTLLVIFGFGLLSIIPIYGSVTPIVKLTKDCRTEYDTIGMRMNSTFMNKIYTPGRNEIYFFVSFHHLDYIINLVSFKFNFKIILLLIY